MFVDTFKLDRNGKTYVRYLLRRSYRENGKVKHRTTQDSRANLRRVNSGLAAAHSGAGFHAFRADGAGVCGFGGAAISAVGLHFGLFAGVLVRGAGYRGAWRGGSVGVVLGQDYPTLQNIG